jgi:hypothetical protein
VEIVDKIKKPLKTKKKAIKNIKKQPFWRWKNSLFLWTSVLKKSGKEKAKKWKSVKISFCIFIVSE